MKDTPSPPSYRKILADCFPADNESGQYEAVSGMSMDAYRVAAGLAPSDAKIGSEEMGRFKDRGHLTRIANDRLSRWHKAHDTELPPGLEPPRSTTDQELGSVYHSLLLTPNEFEEEFTVMSEEVLDDLRKQRKERKLAEDAPKKYSGQLKEAQEFKKIHGRLPENDEEKEQVMLAVRSRFDDDETFPKLEHAEWVAEQEAKGRTVITSATRYHAERMVDALYSHPENTEVGEVVKALSLTRDRVEVSLFAVAEWGRGDNAFRAQLKGRPDAIPLGDDILDPKTAACVHPVAFAQAIDDWHYDFSMAGYIWLTELLAGHPNVEGWDFPKKRAGFLAQEKTPPYLARIHWIPEDWLDAMKRKFQNEMSRLADLYRRGKWSTELMAVQVGNIEPTDRKLREIEFYLQSY